MKPTPPIGKSRDIVPFLSIKKKYTQYINVYYKIIQTFNYKVKKSWMTNYPLNQSQFQGAYILSNTRVIQAIIIFLFSI